MPASTNLPRWAFAPAFSKWFKALCFSLLAIAGPEAIAQAQEAYEAVKPDSVSIYYFGNGKPRTIATFRQGLLHGPTFEYHASGQINFITHYYDGEKAGEQKLFDQAGRCLWVKTWQADRMHGQEWRNNQKHGKSIFYYELGAVAAELEYQFGSQVSATYYDEDGAIKKNFED
jgi:antitoxin component YwqK of YwqJK toxin-antitoxin module